MGRLVELLALLQLPLSTFRARMRCDALPLLLTTFASTLILIICRVRLAAACRVCRVV